MDVLVGVLWVAGRRRPHRLVRVTDWIALLHCSELLYRGLDLNSFIIDSDMIWQNEKRKKNRKAKVQQNCNLKFDLQFICRGRWEIKVKIQPNGGCIETNLGDGS